MSSERRNKLREYQDNEIILDYERAVKFLKSNVLKTVDKWFRGLKLEQTKSTKLSSDYRTQGNNLYKKRNFSAAYDKFKLSIKYGKFDDRDDEDNAACASTLSLVYSNRATVFFFDKKFKHCIDDIGLAIETGYPDDQQHKLYLTEGQAYAAMGDKANSIRSYEKAVKLFEKYSQLETGQKIIFIEKVERIINDCKSKVKCDIVKDRSFMGTTGFEEFIGEYKLANNLACYCKGSPYCNNLYCAFNENVEIRFTTQRGRGLFLKKPMKKDDLIFLDKSCASITGKRLNDDTCALCMRELGEYCVGCKHCSEAFYCNKDCMKAAWEKFHKMECGLQVFLRELKNYCRMAYRLFVQTPFPCMKEVYTSTVLGLAKAHPEDVKRGVMGFKDGVYQPEHYHAIHNLSVYAAVTPAEKGRMLIDCYKLLKLYHYKSEKLGLKENLPQPSKLSELEKIALLMNMIPTEFEDAAMQLFIMQRHVLQCGNYAITTVPNDWDDVIKADVDEYHGHQGAGRVFPLVALLNHSCKPNVYPILNNSGVLAIYRCNRDLKAGEELTDDYVRGLDPLLDDGAKCLCPCDKCSSTITTSVQKHFPDKVVFCEICCARLSPKEDYSEFKCTVAFLHIAYTCKNCLRTASPDTLAVVKSAWEEYQKAGELIKKEKMLESVKHLERCCELRSLIPIPKFSSMVAICWTQLSYLSMATVETMVHYAKQRLELRDKYPELDVYVSLDGLLYIVSTGLQMQINQAMVSNNRRKASRLAKEMAVICKRAIADEDGSGGDPALFTAPLEALKNMRLI